MMQKKIIYLSLSLLLVPAFAFAGEKGGDTGACEGGSSGGPKTATDKVTSIGPVPRKSSGVNPAAKSGKSKSLAVVTAVVEASGATSPKEEEIVKPKSVVESVADQSMLGKLWDNFWGHDANVISEKEKGNFNTSATVVSDSRQNHAVQRLITKDDQERMQKLLTLSENAPLTETGYKSAFAYLHEKQQKELNEYAAIVATHSRSLAERKKMISMTQQQYIKLMRSKIQDENAKIAPLAASDAGYESDSDKYNDPSHCFEKAKKIMPKKLATPAEPTEGKKEDADKK